MNAIGTSSYPPGSGASLSWQSQFIRAADGLKLHVAQIGPRHASTCPVICLPGLSRNVDDFALIGAHLAAIQNRWVVALDSRGRGRSDYDPDWRRYDLAVELEDLLNVLTALGIGEAIFLGTSRGGILTALVGLARPNAIRGAILNDIGPVIEAQGLARIRGYVGKLPPPRSFAEARDILQRLFGQSFPESDAAAWERYAQRTYKEEAGRFLARYDVNLLKTMADLDLEKPIPPFWPQFEALRHAPLLVIRGALSDILSQKTAQEMVERHGNASLHLVPQQGHAPLLEDAPTMRVIADFVARCG